jgi:hypothetical protein
LRLGETALAEHVWSDWNDWIEPTQQHPTPNLDDPFITLAQFWLGARFERCVAAQMRSDDRLALLDAKELTACRKSVETAALKRGFKLRSDANNSNEGEDYFDFLDFLPRLLADQQRRARERPREPVAAVLSRKFPSKAARIAALIRELDQTTGRQNGLNHLPIIEAFVQEGDDAVEPLLECLEKDDRLTRVTPATSGGLNYYRSFFGVNQVACEAISSILRQWYMLDTTDYANLSAAEQRKDLVEEIHSYWNKYKSLPLDERWFAILADDSAPRGDWLDAVRRITAAGKPPGRIGEFPDDLFPVPHEIGTRIPLQGDRLRTKSGPSVSDLLVKRLAAIGQGEPSPSSSDLLDGVTLAKALIEWDGRGHLRELRSFSKLLATTRDRSELSDPAAELFLDRIKLGDDKAVAEYIVWIRDVDPARIPFPRATIFKPMWEFGDCEEMAHAADDLFNGNNSRWNPLQIPNSTNFSIYELVDSRLIGLRAFRQQLIRELDDKSMIGKVKYDGGYRFTFIESQGASSEYLTQCQDDPYRPKSGEDRPFRACDYVASRLQPLGGFPEIQLYWPEHVRDGAVRKTQAMLLQYGQRFAWTPEQDRLNPVGKPTMTFPPLNHPATPDDVDKGRAIFALEGERRVFPLPFRPFRVRWTTLKTVSVTSLQYESLSAPPNVVTRWQQDGDVWQAEEVRHGDKWVRWYGFVGPGFIGKAPADEIELNTPLMELQHGIYWWCDLEAMTTATDPAIPIPVGKPVLVSLHIKNSLGTDQALSTDWYRAAEKAFRPGIQIHLQRSLNSSSSGSDIDAGPWRDIPCKQAREFTPSRATRLIGPAAELPAITFDLRDFYTLEKPGAYRVSLVGPSADKGKTRPETQSEWFTLVSGPNGRHEK